MSLAGAALLDKAGPAVQGASASGFEGNDGDTFALVAFSFVALLLVVLSVTVFCFPIISTRLATAGIVLVALFRKEGLL